MKFRLRSTDLREIIYQRDLPGNFTTTGAMEETEFEIGYGDYAGGYFREQWFEGIHILYGNLKINRDMRLKADNETPVIEMHFSLSGHKRAGFSNSTRDFMFSPGEHNLFYIPYFDGYFDSFEQKKTCETLEIHLSRSYFERITRGRSRVLDRFLRDMEHKKVTLMGRQNRLISAEMYRVIRELLHCTRTGIFKRFFLESKVLELLMLQIEQFQETRLPELQQQDREKVYYVKSILEEDCGGSFSLETLARRSGLNEFKLKKGFRKIFGTTVFGYLRDLRLEEARAQLLSGEKTIQEIADTCGYRSTQYFTTAFRKKYGITPGKYR